MQQIINIKTMARINKILTVSLIVFVVVFAILYSVTFLLQDEGVTLVMAVFAFSPLALVFRVLTLISVAASVWGIVLSKIQEVTLNTELKKNSWRLLFMIGSLLVIKKIIFG